MSNIGSHRSCGDSFISSCCSSWSCGGWPSSHAPLWGRLTLEQYTLTLGLQSLTQGQRRVTQGQRRVTKGQCGNRFEMRMLTLEPWRITMDQLSLTLEQCRLALSLWGSGGLPQCSGVASLSCRGYPWNWEGPLWGVRGGSPWRSEAHILSKLSSSWILSREMYKRYCLFFIFYLSRHCFCFI